jgi:hypothetical protein
MDPSGSRLLWRWRCIARCGGLVYLPLAKASRRSHIQARAGGPWRGSAFATRPIIRARTVLCITLIASAAFIIVAVDSFRRSGVSVTDRKSGTGGYPLLAESLLPVVHDPNTTEGRESLNLNTDEAALKNLTFVNFRVRPWR